MAKTEVCINFTTFILDLCACICLYLSRLGYYLVPVLGCQFFTGLTDRVWEISCGSVPDGSIVLAFCIHPSQDLVLRSYIGSFGLIYQWWPVEALKVGAFFGIFGPPR